MRKRRVADSDDEELDSDGEPRRKGKKRQRFDEDGNAIDDVSLLLCTLLSSGLYSCMQEEEGQPKRLSRKERKQHKSKLDRYHRAGTFYGQSVAGQMYILATLLQRTDNDALWYVFPLHLTLLTVNIATGQAGDPRSDISIPSQLDRQRTVRHLRNSLR